MFTLTYFSINISLASVHQELIKGLTKQKTKQTIKRQQFLSKIFVARWGCFQM